MKSRRTQYAALTLATAACFVAPFGWSQSAPPAPAATPAENEEETVVLSPFVVDATEDSDNYRATATLAGSRVRTELKDIASPLSVVTAQFLQDTAATNSMDLLTYTTSTEVGGLYGNWGGFGNAQGVSDRGNLLAPNNNTRVRGLDQADNTRGFFLTDIPWDSYNVDRVEIQRGPNSILFGVGSPAGIINTNTIQARFDGNSGKIENRFGQFNSVRWTLDYNAELIDDMLAVRFAGLDTDQNYRQEPAFNDEKRGYLTATFQPQVLPESWAGRMTIRASVELANVIANRPRILPPEDGISLWFEDYAGDGVNNKIGFGKNVYDMFLWSQGGGGDASRNPAGVNYAGLSATVRNPLPYQPGVGVIDGGALNNGGIGFWFRNGDQHPYFVSRQAPRAFPGALDAAGVPGNNPISIPYGSPMRVGGLNSYALTLNKIDEVEGVAEASRRYPLATRGYYKDQTLNDESIFNFYEQLIDGDNKREHQKWDAQNIAISQTFMDNRLGLEFVYDTQNYQEWRTGATWNRPYISIDINKNLQNQLTQYTRVDHDGNAATAPILDTSTYQAVGFTPTAAQPYVNPMAGAAFTAGSFSNNNRAVRERDNYRLTAFGEVRGDDFFDRESTIARILGRHVFTGLASREERHEAQTQWAPSATTWEWANSLSVSGENTDLGESPRGITPLIYLSEPLFNRNTARGLNLGPIATPYNPSGSYTVNYFKTEWLPSTNPASPSYVNPGAAWTNLLGDPTDIQARNPFNYRGYTVAQTNILNADDGDIGQLVTNYGVTDQVVDSVGLVWQAYLFDGTIVPTVGWREDTLETFTGTGAKTRGVASTDVGELDKVLENTGQTTSWGVVGHLPQAWLEKVPVLSGLSGYYNYGENNRVEARYNYDGEPLANPSAESKDYGIVVSAMEGKLNLKLGRFETKVKNANLAGSNLLGPNMYYLYNLEAWGTANTLAYAFGREGLDPNQFWHWNWALVDDNAWGNENGTYAWNTDLFRNHPSSVRQLAAMDAWMAGIDEQFFSNYAINADVPALQTAYNTWRSGGGIQPLVAAAAAGAFGAPTGGYATRFSSQNNGQINGITPNGTIDNTSKGYELEISYNPVPNWNIQINAAKTDAYRESLGQPMLDYIAGQWERLQGPAGDIRLWWGGDNTIRRYYQDNIMSAVQFQQESIGFQVPELRPKRFQGITTYTFEEGALKGIKVGGAYRWEDKQILGYGMKDDVSGLDVTKSMFGDAESHFDLWFGYQRRVRENLTWQIQLNLRNVGESKGLTPISVNPDGVVAAQRITEGMGWSITNSVSF